MDADTGFCNGCMRTIEEIMDWGSASNPQKLAVLESLEARRIIARRPVPQNPDADGTR